MTWKTIKISQLPQKRSQKEVSPQFGKSIDVTITGRNRLFIFQQSAPQITPLQRKTHRILTVASRHWDNYFKVMNVNENCAVSWSRGRDLLLRCCKRGRIQATSMALVFWKRYHCRAEWLHEPQGHEKWMSTMIKGFKSEHLVPEMESWDNFRRRKAQKYDA